MKRVLGLVEISGLSTAIVVADIMVRAASVRILEIENTKGLGYMTVKIIGDVGTANATVNAGEQIGIADGKLVSWKVIPGPSDYVDQTFCYPGPPVPPSPPKKETQEETETEVEVKAETMEAVKTGESEEVGLEEIASEDTEQEIEVGPAKTGLEPRIEAEPIEIKSGPLVEVEPTRTETIDPAEPEIPGFPKTPSERSKKTVRRTTSTESASTIGYKRN